jgi:hypothetical protein
MSAEASAAKTGVADRKNRKMKANNKPKTFFINPSLPKSF